MVDEPVPLDITKAIRDVMGLDTRDTTKEDESSDDNQDTII